MKIKIFHIASSIKFIGLFVGWSINISKNRGWGKIEIKDHLSPAEAGNHLSPAEAGTELGN